MYKQKRLFKIFSLCALATSFASGCLKNDNETIALPEIGSAASVIPSEIRDEFESQMEIYEGTNPPDISGSFVISPVRLYYATDRDKAPTSPADDYITFYNKKGNTYEFQSKQAGARSYSPNVIVIGSGNNFTAYFTERTDYDDEDSWLIQSTLISGTITARGIENIKNAFIALDVYDPKNHIMDENEFRIFYDADNISLFTDWYYTKSPDGWDDSCGIFDNSSDIKAE